MTDHKSGTREEWLAARLELLDAEKALTRRSDELARQRQELPWVRIDKKYRLDTDAGPASLTDLVAGRASFHRQQESLRDRPARSSPSIFCLMEPARGSDAGRFC